jgi:hypothetical protein
MGVLLIASLGALGALIWAALPEPAEACGGFFCNGGGGGTGPTPVVQAAERVIFEQREDGTVRAYVQIRYDQQGGVPIGFSWIIPVLAAPEVGIAEAATFDQLDAATSPQFRFINNARPVASSGGGGVGCGGSDDRAPSGAAPESGTMDVDGVTVWESARIGEYETATIEGESAAVLLEWLELNGYDIPAQAADIVDDYVTEGHLFVAFKYDPIGAGSGTLDPIVLTYTGVKPCVPIRITAIASTPVLDVMVLAFGPQRASPDGPYLLTDPDYDAIRPDFSMPTGTTYGDEVMGAIGDAGGRAFVTEYAAPTAELQGLTDLEAQALVSRNGYVTRFYTRLTPEAMTIDPEFVFPGGEDVDRLHVIDITQPMTRAGSTSSPLRYAVGPGAIVFAGLALLWRRRRR